MGVVDRRHHRGLDQARQPDLTDRPERPRRPTGTSAGRLTPARTRARRTRPRTAATTTWRSKLLHSQIHKASTPSRPLQTHARPSKPDHDNDHQEHEHQPQHDPVRHTSCTSPGGGSWGSSRCPGSARRTPLSSSSDPLSAAPVPALQEDSEGGPEGDPVEDPIGDSEGEPVGEVPRYLRDTRDSQAVTVTAWECSISH
jgi:hypothetical protein